MKLEIMSGRRDCVSWVFWGSFLLIWAVDFAAVVASDQQQKSAAVSPDGVGAESSAVSDLRFNVEATSPHGSLTYVPEQWGELHLRLENRGDLERDLTCATYFGDDSTLQFARRVWLPPNSKLRISHPVLIPKRDKSDNRNQDLRSLVIDNSSSNETLLKNESGQMIHDGAILVTPSPRNTGIIVSDDLAKKLPQEVYDILIASRVYQKLGNKYTVLGDSFLPSSDKDLNYLDHLVIAEDRVATDDAAIVAIRRWLHGGGRLWVMLDRVDPLILERLLGDDFDGHLVDRVDLTTVRIDKPISPTVVETVLGASIEYDEPVTLARVVASGMKVWNTVNGWPAALSKPVGQGHLLITTLGPRAWLKPMVYASPKDRPTDPVLQTEFEPRDPLTDLSAYILGRRGSPLLPRPMLEQVSNEYIGYSVPSWWQVVGTMIIFLLLLFAIGISLARRGWVEYFGAVGPILAVLVSGLLLLIGWTYRHGVPDTLASVQLVQPIRGTDDVRGEGLITVYQSEGGSAVINSRHGGQLWPDMTGLEGATRRLVMTDFDTSRWEGVKQPSGVRTSSFLMSDAPSSRMWAEATLQGEEIVGKYHGCDGLDGDAIVATRSGRIGVTAAAAGTFRAGVEDVLGRNQLLDASFLTDERDRRRRLLEKLLKDKERKGYPDRPLLLLWLKSWDNGFSFDDHLQPRGATLAAIPLQITRPAAETEILIPSPLIWFQTQASPDGMPSSGVWNDAREEFQERASPGSTWLRFQLPKELLPLAVSKIRLQLEVFGPMGRAEVFGVKRGEIARLHTINDPVGVVQIQIEETDVLGVDPRDASLSLGFTFGDPTRPHLTNSSAPAGGNATNINENMKMNYWKIESLNATVWAKTLAPNSKD